MIPDEIYNFTDVFDARLWNLTELIANNDDSEEIVNTLQDNMTVLIDK